MAQTNSLPAQSSSKVPSLRDSLDKMKPEFAKALPGHISPEKFIRTAQTALALTRGIDRIKDRQSLMAACTKAAADGLILDGREAAIVIDRQGVAQYRPMMRGLLKLAYNSGQIKGLTVDIVRTGDIFRHVPTNFSQPIHHEINHEKERGEPHTVYAMAELKDGGIVHEVMSVADVNHIRDRSDAFKAYKLDKIKSTPWATDWSEMARKTVFRRLSKYLPSSTDRDNRLAQAAERIDDDYSFEIDGEPAEGSPKTGPAPKKRGGAAAALKDITPAKEQQAADDDASDGDHDPETGEVYDGDYDQQDGDDI